MKKKILILVLVSFGISGFSQQADTSWKEYLGVLTLTEKFQEEKNWTDREESLVGEHFQRLVKYKNEGLVLLAGRTPYKVSVKEGMGLVIFYARNDEEANRFMQDDPAVKAGIMYTKVHPYAIALMQCDKRMEVKE